MTSWWSPNRPDKWTVRKIATWWAAIAPTGWVTMFDTWEDAMSWALGGGL